VAKEGLAASVLVSSLVGLPVKGTSRISRIQPGRLGAHFAEPIEEVGQLGDDVRGILRRAWRPAQAAGVEPGLPVEGPGVEPLGEVLEQTIGVALGWIRLEVLKEHPHRAGHLCHPG
jgi:hypothetical protein